VEGERVEEPMKVSGQKLKTDWNKKVEYSKDRKVFYIHAVFEKFSW